MQGTPAAVKKAIAAITDLEHLDELRLWLLDVTSWEELLGFPKPPYRSMQ